MRIPPKFAGILINDPEARLIAAAMGSGLFFKIGDHLQGWGGGWLSPAFVWGVPPVPLGPGQGSFFSRNVFFYFGFLFLVLQDPSLLHWRVPLVPPLFGGWDPTGPPIGFPTKPD